MYKLARLIVGVGTALVFLGSQRISAGLESIVYTVRAPAPESHVAQIEATIPTEGADSVELMMPVWSPGFYKVEDYARHVQEPAARAADGAALRLEQTQKNRWRVATDGAASIVLSYRLNCTGRSVTTNSVGEDFAVFNPGAAFITPV